RVEFLDVHLMGLAQGGECGCIESVRDQDLHRTAGYPRANKKLRPGGARSSARGAPGKAPRRGRASCVSSAGPSRKLRGTGRGTRRLPIVAVVGLGTGPPVPGWRAAPSEWQGAVRPRTTGRT